MQQFENLRVERDQRGVVRAYIDVPGRPVNVFYEGLLRDLSELVSQLEQERDTRFVVFRSGKESGFLAGADLTELQHVTSLEEGERMLRAGQDLFDRISRLPMPTLAVIHGPCLGGGLEFALACTYRMAQDDASTRIGLPETQLGLIPAWGGCQRLPRLIGLAPALQMILQGSRLPAAKARSKGVVDFISTPERIDADLNALIADRLAGRPLVRRKPALMERIRDFSALARPFVLRVAERRIRHEVAHYPALPAAIRAIAAGLKHGMARGLEVEREEFWNVVRSPTSRNLINLFFQREKSRKRKTWLGAEDHPPLKIETVAVIGAGMMGAGIAQAAAYQGLRVVLKDISAEIVAKGMQRIEGLMQDAVRNGLLSAAESGQRLAAITATHEWQPVNAADLAIEAVVEKMSVKQDVFRELDARLRPEAILVSNTSALPISEMASVTIRKEQIGGLHFFNPVHKMPLVEVVRTPVTSDRTIAALVDLVRTLGKAPIVVAESPGFLVNRILFPYLDEAVRLVCEGGGIEEVDREARRFGMPMGPLELLDYVGLDVGADVSRTMSALAAEASPTPQKLTQMAAAGMLGKKSGQGFYTYAKEKKPEPQPRSTDPADRPRLPQTVRFANGEQVNGLQQRLVFAMLNESAKTLQEKVVAEPWMVDLAMVLGTGFAPFRGGPLRLIDTWGITEVAEALERTAASLGARFQPTDLLREMREQGSRFFPEAADVPETPAAARSAAP